MCSGASICAYTLTFYKLGNLQWPLLRRQCHHLTIICCLIHHLTIICCLVHHLTIICCLVHHLTIICCLVHHLTIICCLVHHLTIICCLVHHLTIICCLVHHLTIICCLVNELSRQHVVCDNTQTIYIPLLLASNPNSLKPPQIPPHHRYHWSADLSPCLHDHYDDDLPTARDLNYVRVHVS